jgi:hypothetical protein
VDQHDAIAAFSPSDTFRTREPHIHVVHAVAGSTHHAGGSGQDINALLLLGQRRQAQIGAVMAVISHGSATEILRPRAGIVIDIILDEAVLADAAIERNFQNKLLHGLGEAHRSRAKQNGRDKPDGTDKCDP